MMVSVMPPFVLLGIFTSMSGSTPPLNVFLVRTNGLQNDVLYFSWPYRVVEKMMSCQVQTFLGWPSISFLLLHSPAVYLQPVQLHQPGSWNYCQISNQSINKMAEKKNDLFKIPTLWKTDRHSSMWAGPESTSSSLCPLTRFPTCWPDNVRRIFSTTPLHIKTARTNHGKTLNIESNTSNYAEPHIYGNEQEKKSGPLHFGNRMVV